MSKYKKHDNMAIQEINEGNSIHGVAKKFGIAKTKLYRRWSQKIPVNTYSGASTVLSIEQENHLCTWIKTSSKKGFSITKDKLLDSVQLLLVELELEMARKR